MTEYSTVSILKNSIIFKGVDGKELEKAFETVPLLEKSYVKNQIMINQGEPVSHIGILKKGSAISVKYHLDGNSQILRLYQEGEVFSLDTVNTSLATSPATLISQTDSAVIYLPYAKLIGDHSLSEPAKEKIMSNCSMILSNELIRLMYKIDVLSKRTLRERILTYLSLIGERSGETCFDIGMNQEQFAQYLCVNRSVLSNELNKMRKLGLIDYRGNRYSIFHQE